MPGVASSGLDDIRQNPLPREKSAPLGGARAEGELTTVMPGLVPGIHVLTASQ
jgi:hypothetical protein